MRKYGKRVAALALALVVALGSVCYNPPKAEAVFVESAAAMAGAFTYLSATGFEFAGDGTAYGAMADAFQMMFTDWTEEYDAYVNEVSGYPEVVAPTLQETILGGMTLLENGFVEFSAAAANALGQFEDWLVGKLGLIDENGSPSGQTSYVYEMMDYPSMPDVDEAKQRFWVITTDNWLYFSRRGNLIATDTYFLVTSNPCDCPVYSLRDGAWVLESSISGQVSFEYSLVKYVSEDIIHNGAVILTGSEFPVSYETDTELLSVALSSGYASAPAVEEQYAMVIDTGLTLEDEQSFIDAVMGSALAGTLFPAYTIEQATAGDVVVPDEDEQENTQTGILSWTKKIWQSVQELPRTIADAVADVFVPSAEYMATVPVVITETFDNRTGFLTYPVSVLHDFAGRLSAGSQDFILKWPTVYEPYSKVQLMAAGQFNVSEYVRDNDFASYVYGIYQWVVKAYMTFLFLGLCRRKYNSVVGDRLEG